MINPIGAGMRSLLRCWDNRNSTDSQRH